MVSRTLEQGIQAIQQGNTAEGGRLLRIALKEPDLTPQNRAVAYLWLAETQDAIDEKIQSYRMATQADPMNSEAAQRLNYYLSQQLPDNRPPANQPRYPNMPSFEQNYYQQTQQPPAVNPPNNAPYSAQSAGYVPPQATPPNTPYQAPAQGQGDFWQQGAMPNINPPPNTQPAPHNAQSAPYPTTGTIHLKEVQHSVGIISSNGRGTGFFVTRDGLIATTRFLVGAELQVQVELLDRRMIMGDVVRSFPEYDLAFVQTPVQLERLSNVSRDPNLLDNTPLVAVTFPDGGLQTTKRATRHQTEPHWFPTLITRLLDAGGNPIFNQVNNALVGMLTKNARRTNQMMYGLHVSKIYQCVGVYDNELRQDPNRTYCNSCGAASRSRTLGGFYCEFCGHVLPYAVSMQRYPQHSMITLYGENTERPCPNCQSTVGFYRGECLRCGYDL